MGGSQAAPAPTDVRSRVPHKGWLSLPNKHHVALVAGHLLGRVRALSSLEQGWVPVLKFIRAICQPLQTGSDETWFVEGLIKSGVRRNDAGSRDKNDIAATKAARPLIQSRAIPRPAHGM
jgi:hypothetical protein